MGAKAILKDCTDACRRVQARTHVARGGLFQPDDARRAFAILKTHGTYVLRTSFTTSTLMRNSTADAPPGLLSTTSPARFALPRARALGPPRRRSNSRDEKMLHLCGPRASRRKPVAYGSACSVVDDALVRRGNVRDWVPRCVPDIQAESTR